MLEIYPLGLLLFARQHSVQHVVHLCVVGTVQLGNLVAGSVSDCNGFVLVLEIIKVQRDVLKQGEKTPKWAKSEDRGFLLPYVHSKF